jgi:hypothetical protein
VHSASRVRQVLVPAVAKSAKFSSAQRVHALASTTRVPARGSRGAGRRGGRIFTPSNQPKNCDAAPLGGFLTPYFTQRAMLLLERSRQARQDLEALLAEETAEPSGSALLDESKHTRELLFAGAAAPAAASSPCASARDDRSERVPPLPLPTREWRKVEEPEASNHHVLWPRGRIPRRPADARSRVTWPMPADPFLRDEAIRQRDGSAAPMGGGGSTSAEGDDSGGGDGGEELNPLATRWLCVTKAAVRAHCDLASKRMSFVEVSFYAACCLLWMMMTGNTAQLGCARAQSFR